MIPKKIYLNKVYSNGVQFAMINQSDEYHIPFISVEALKEWIEAEDKKLEFGGIIRKNELLKFIEE